MFTKKVYILTHVYKQTTFQPKKHVGVCQEGVLEYWKSSVVCGKRVLVLQNEPSYALVFIIHDMLCVFKWIKFK